jgi:transcriptional regulator with XRE-family HTH domain
MADVPRGSALLAAYVAAEGLTQQEAAQRLGIHQSTLSRWVCGKQRPDIDQVLRLRDEIGIPVEAWATHYEPPTVAA